MSVAQSALAVVGPLQVRVGREVVDGWHIYYLDLVEIRVDDGRQVVGVAGVSGGPVGGLKVVVDELLDQRCLAYSTTP